MRPHSLSANLSTALHLPTKQAGKYDILSFFFSVWGLCRTLATI
jgi:hypothetical protein